LNLEEKGLFVEHLFLPNFLLKPRTRHTRNMDGAGYPKADTAFSQTLPSLTRTPESIPCGNLE